MSQPAKHETPLDLDDLLGYRPKEILEELTNISKLDQVTANLPTELPIDQIHEHTELFQPRELDERHIQELCRAIKAQGGLEAVTIFQVGEKAILIDGHHRREAYRRSGVIKAIPVQYFQGSLEEAVLEAGRANSKAKLPMITSERQNYAWRLVLLNAYSKKQVREAASISDGQVAIMRRAKTALGEEAYDYENWSKARDAFNEREREPLDNDQMGQWLDGQANDYADRLSREFGKKLPRNTTLAARAFDIHFGRRLPDLVEALQGYLPDTEEQDEDDF
tara:strand:+ start:3272 stop:4108 length:837 start_codon:yes stop_codon:yes gene_type:complete